MKRKALALAALLYLVVPALAVGDWQYARWGMTVEEVEKASAGAAIPIPEAQRQSRSNGTARATLSATFSSGRFTFGVDFLFDRNNNGLSRISLTLNEKSECPLLERSLADKYGEPVESVVNSIMKRLEWRDAGTGNGVQYLYLGTPLCYVAYYPLATADNKDL